jgi:hypothetical protein
VVFFAGGFHLIGVSGSFSLGGVVGRGKEEGKVAEAGFEGPEMAVGPMSCAKVGGDGGVFFAEEVEKDKEGDGT